MDVNTKRLSGMNYKLECCVKLVVDMIRDGDQKFVYDTDGQTFLKRKLMGFGVNRNQ